MRRIWGVRNDVSVELVLSDGVFEGVFIVELLCAWERRGPRRSWTE